MYIPMPEQRLRVMTAADGDRIPTLDVIQKLPTIQMSLSETYRASEKSRDRAVEVLRQSAIAKPRGPIGFERQLPEIITGADEDWSLWRVDFYLARLKLYYVDATIRDERYHLTGGTATDSIGHFRSCGYAYLVSPSAIGLSFDIPELDWHICYEMNSSSSTGSHSVRFSETYQGASSGEFNYNVPSVAPFVPTDYHRS